jgi:phage terminase large subunit GpA-like protein
MAAPIASPTAAEITVGGRRLQTGIKVYLIDVSHYKSELFGRLRLDSPTAGEEAPDGFFTIREVYDTVEYCKQLTAEQLITRTVKGYQRREWEKIRPRNEALDTWVYARAAAVLLGIDRFQESHWKQLEVTLGVAPRPERPPLPADGWAAATPAPRHRRSSGRQIVPPVW